MPETVWDFTYHLQGWFNLPLLQNFQDYLVDDVRVSSFNCEAKCFFELINFDQVRYFLDYGLFKANQEIRDLFLLSRVSYLSQISKVNIQTHIG